MSFKCEDDDNTEITDCGDWGDCKAAGECLLAKAMTDTSWADLDIPTDIEYQNYMYGSSRY